MVEVNYPVEHLYKVGDWAEIKRPHFDKRLNENDLGKEVKVVKLLPRDIFKYDWEYTVHDKEGNLIDIFQICLNDHKNTVAMKAMKDAVLTVAKQLAKANNTVTTLEIKTELRRDFPYFYWTQEIVSKFMDQLAGDGVFFFTDNGTYRTYSLVSSLVATPAPVTKLAGSNLAFNTLRKTGITKRGRPRKNTVIITQVSALKMASDRNFTSVTLANGKTVTLGDIRGQKKSPVGYLTPKLGKIKAIKVGTTNYQVN